MICGVNVVIWNTLPHSMGITNAITCNHKGHPCTESQDSVQEMQREKSRPDDTSPCLQQRSRANELLDRTVGRHEDEQSKGIKSPSDAIQYGY
jgi:hypothetical protein